MKKKVAIFTYSLASGGTERVVSILVNELKNIFDLTLVLMDDIPFYNLPKDVKVVQLRGSNTSENGISKILKLPILAFKYKNFCKKNNIEVSFSLLNRPNYINVISKLMGNKVKVIISERSMPSLQHQAGLKGSINRFLIKKLYPSADLVIANSLGNSNDLINNFYLDKVVTIHNPFDIKNIESLSSMAIKLLSDKFTFITVGRLDSGKNHALLIDAIQSIDANLYIIGDGILREKLEGQIKKLGLENRVFLLGIQSNPYKYISKADCFLFASGHEGFPNVLLEALACGLPVISTDCKSGPREILSPESDITKQLHINIEYSEFGILVPVNNTSLMTRAMEVIMKDKQIANHYRKKARIRAASFDKIKIIEEFVDAINFKR